MSNLGLNCDLQSCHLCDDCIYDVPPTEEEEETTMENNSNETKRGFCHGCKYHEIRQVSSGGTYVNTYCKYNGSPIIISLNKERHEMDKTPIWCGFNKAIDNGENKPFETKTKLSWYTADIKPKIKWCDLKMGATYHIPPFNNSPRVDIKIVNITNTVAYYDIIGTNKHDMFYQSSVAYKLLVPNKHPIMSKK